MQPGDLAGELAVALRRRTATLSCLEDSVFLGLNYARIMSACPDSFKQELDRRITSRIVESAWNSAPYFLGEDKTGLTEMTAPWLSLLASTKRTRLSWKEGDTITLEHPVFEPKTFCVLISGGVTVQGSPDVTLDGVDYPLLFADLPDDGRAGVGTFKLQGDIDVLMIRWEDVKKLGLPAYREIMRRVTAEIGKRGDAQPVATDDVVRIAASPTSGPARATAGEKDAAPENAQRLIILVHGIRTRAEWQGRLRHLFEADGRTSVESLGYGYFDAFRFLCPLWTRQGPVKEILRKVRDALNRHRDERKEVIFVAHSFGTFILSKILSENPDICPDRVLLCGSIISRTYQWDALPNRPQIVVNEAGSRDIWPILAKSVTWGYGYTGTFGFQTTGVRDRFHDLSHSDYFKDGFAEEYWVPWIRDKVLKPSSYETGNRPATPFYKNLLAFVPLKYLIPAAVVLLIWFTLARYRG
jgi:pimeloyl-ACP methyl ester carboxylesterase